MLLKSLILKLLPEKILSRLKKIHYVRALKEFSEQEEPDLIAAKRFVEAGDYIVDVGANIGWYTKVFSEKVGETGKVFSVEPVPSTFDLLSYCVKKLKLLNVELFCFAVSDKVGEVVMEIPLYEGGGENFYRSRIISHELQGHSYRRISVQLCTLDAMFLDLPTPIKFIKCDVEGHELSVVKGAETLIAKFRPAWLIEVSDSPEDDGSSSNQLFSLLLQYGYQAYRFDGVQLVSRSPGDKSINYFFLTSDHVKVYHGKSS